MNYQAVLIDQTEPHQALGDILRISCLIGDSPLNTLDYLADC
jgi:hypothetical protein